MERPVPLSALGHLVITKSIWTQSSNGIQGAGSPVAAVKPTRVEAVGVLMLSAAPSSSTMTPAPLFRSLPKSTVRRNVPPFPSGTVKFERYTSSLTIIVSGEEGMDLMRYTAAVSVLVGSAGRVRASEKGLE